LETIQGAAGFLVPNDDYLFCLYDESFGFKFHRKYFANE
jgi:hypothetical protein